MENTRSFDVTVVGAGVFGTWTALELQRAGARTLLVDAWGVGHPRASSGGESRIIRTGYGHQILYSRWAWESLVRWRELEQETETTLFIPCGVLWLYQEDNAEVRESLRSMRRLGVPHQDLASPELAQRFPQFNLESVDRGLLEPECGALLARLACRQVARHFLAGGGTFQFGQAIPPDRGAGRLESLQLQSGLRLHSDSFVFCLGPWLGTFLKDVVGRRVVATRQEVFFLGTPPGSQQWFPADFPAWIDVTGEECFYGLPALDGRGVKIASDSRGPRFDPSLGKRLASPEGLANIRHALRRRLPTLADAPVVESRVCQYEQTPDSNLIVDRHPDYENVWLAGGGSGHGFKLGPAVGRLAASLITDRGAQPPGEVGLGRFAG